MKKNSKNKSKAKSHTNVVKARVNVAYRYNLLTAPAPIKKT